MLISTTSECATVRCVAGLERREGRAPLSYIPDGFSRAQARIAFMALFLRASVSSVAAFFFAFFLGGFFFARFANATPSR